MAKANADTLTREGAGNWRTKDGRFLIRGESGAHWYVVDAVRRDAFGLELITGPYSTINAAKAAIAEARAEARDPVESTSAGPVPAAPGAAKATEAAAEPDAAMPGPAAPGGAAAAEPKPLRARRPGRSDVNVPAPPASGAGASPSSADGAPTAQRTPKAAAPVAAAPVAAAPVAAAPRGASRPTGTKGGATGGGATAAADQAPERVPASPPVPTPAPAPPPTPPEPEWLARLTESERRRARRTIAELERIGIADAAGVTRRDVSADAPEVARALLRRRLAAIADRSADPDLARAVLGEALRLLAISGHDPDAPELAGWALVETGRSTPARRILLDRDDLEKVSDQPRRADGRPRTTRR